MGVLLSFGDAQLLQAGRGDEFAEHVRSCSGGNRAAIKGASAVEYSVIPARAAN